MKTQIGQFKGKPTITLNPGAKYPFTFGADKARMIVENIDDIRAFVAGAPSGPVKVFFTHPNGGKGQSQYATREAADAGMAALRAAGFECSFTGGPPADPVQAVRALEAISPSILNHVNGNR